MRYWGSAILVFLVLAGCSSAPPTTSTAIPTITAFIEPTIPRTMTVPVTSPTVPVSPSATQRPVTPTGTPVPPFQMCSPLGWETIAELWEIISDPYAPPAPGSDERHQGVDFSHWSRKGHSSIQGEPVQSVMPGRVAAITIDRLPYGNMVIIETPQDAIPVDLRQSLEMEPGESLYLLYAHFDQPPEVVLDQQVSCGQVIGAVGMTGYNVVNAHLHLETRLGPAGTTFGSMAFYTTSATVEEMETYKRWRTGGEFKHFDPMRLFAYSR